jgi:hypothetical protein
VGAKTNNRTAVWPATVLDQASAFRAKLFGVRKQMVENEKKPPCVWGLLAWQCRVCLLCDPVGPLSFRIFRRLDRQPHLLRDVPADEATYRMILPVGGLRDLSGRGALLLAQQFKHDRFLAAGARHENAGILASRPTRTQAVAKHVKESDCIAL